MIASLPRREREIFEAICSAGEITAAEIRRSISNPPSHSAVRTLLSRLEAKGLVRHRTADQTYVYSSVPQPALIRETALRQMVKTFFDGSATSAATALLGLSKSFDDDELTALQKVIDKARGDRA